jgi:hypothetical protein
MRVFAIDPGTTHTGYAIMDGMEVKSFGIIKNYDLLTMLEIVEFKPDVILVYEMVACYGMAVGAEVFDTCVWIGRFIERFKGLSLPVFRRDVKHHLCNSAKAKDGNVRQAILDKYPATGGGATPQVGTKKQPGPLYGVNSHVWPAIGVGLTFQNL